MIGDLLTLGRRRTEIQRQIAGHRQRMTAAGGRLADHFKAYVGTPNAVLQSFLAGFLINQARPIVSGLLRIGFLRRALPYLPALSSLFTSPET